MWAVVEFAHNFNDGGCMANKKIDEILKRKQEKQESFEKAVEVLVRLNALIPADSRTLYHGRVSKPDDLGTWQVDSSYQNAGLQENHGNLNIVNGLSTTPDLKTAAMYARGRARTLNKIANKNGEEEYIPEYYEIKPESSGLYILNNFDFKVSKLTDEERKEYFSALNVFMNYEPTELAPIKFEHRENIGDIYKSLSERLVEKINSYEAGKITERLLTKADIDEVVNVLLEKKSDEYLNELAYEIAGALNAREMLAINPSVLVSKLTFKSEDAFDEIENSEIYIFGNDGIRYKVPVSREYVASWLVNNRIIGISKDVLEIGINNCFIFDLEKINTDKALGDRLQSIMAEFGEFSEIAKEGLKDEQLQEFLEISSPEETMEVFRANPKFKRNFDLWSGVWENFSIGEHTETTMRVFEDSFARTIPKELAPFFKIALACHDIGKGVVNDTMYNSPNKLAAIDEETKSVAKEFCEYYNMSEAGKNILVFAIVEGQKYTSAYYIRKNQEALEMLKQRGKEVLAENLKREPTEAEVSGLVSVCKIIQACDSGAYTRYGITRNEKTGEYYRNGNDMFTKSFHTPTDMRKRAQRMIEPNEQQNI